MHKLRPAVVALLELGILFLPAIPAYLWLWPGVKGTTLADLAQVLAYGYVLCGALWIGRRCWTYEQLGLNLSGLWLGLACGAVLLADCLLALGALGVPVSLRPLDWGRLAGEGVYYIGVVGLVEELLFRGVMFRALADWRGPGLAILGSAAGFALWHVARMGALIIGPFLIGLAFGLVRWRAGGIAGLILAHGLFDVFAAEAQISPGILTIDQLLRLPIVNPAAGLAGDALVIALVFYVWKLYPRGQQRRRSAG